MFNAFSWSEFFSLIAIVTVGYYAVAGVIFFQREIKNRFTSPSGEKDNKTTSVESRSDADLIERIEATKVPLSDQRSALTSSEEILFADTEEALDEIQPVQSKPAELAVGTIPDLLEEIKTVMTQLSTADVDTAELTTIFETLLARYPQLRNTPYQETISVFIHELSKENLNAAIPLQQVRTWWS